MTSLITEETETGQIMQKFYFYLCIYVFDSSPLEAAFSF